MYRSKVAIVIAAAAGFLAGFPVQAQSGETPFSAEIIQQGPQGQSSTGKMFVGKDRVRTDMTQNGEKIIHIVDNEQQMEWILYPSQRSYMAMPRRASEGASPEATPPANPCAGMQGVTCKNLGKERVHGRQATKWQMTYEHQGETMTGTQWIDEERRVPLRQVMPNGQTTELRMLGMDNIGGRTVEKWEMTAMRGNEAPQRAYQWYDPKLELAVREEFPGGHVRELRNIRIGHQPDALFSIPAGYREISVPSGEMQPQR